MVVYEKIYFKAYTSDLYISHKNNIAQLYFIYGRAELRWNFSNILKDAFDIHRFSNRNWVLRSVYTYHLRHRHRQIVNIVPMEQTVSWREWVL